VILTLSVVLSLASVIIMPGLRQLPGTQGRKSAGLRVIHVDYLSVTMVLDIYAYEREERGTANEVKSATYEYF